MTKPGRLADEHRLLAHAPATSSIAASVSSVVSSPRTTSTSFIMCTGLKKCIPTRAGPVAHGAISVMLSEDVLVANSACAARRPIAREQLALDLDALGHRFDHAAPRPGGVLRGLHAHDSRASAAVRDRPAATSPSSTPFARFLATAVDPTARARPRARRPAAATFLHPSRPRRGRCRGPSCQRRGRRGAQSSSLPLSVTRDPLSVIRSPFCRLPFTARRAWANPPAD